MLHIPRLRQLHRFLARHSLVPLALSSLLAVVLLAGRVYRSHSILYIFLLWNLFLAWIPYAGSLWADSLHGRHPRQWWLLAGPGLLWLIFFPNAPYIVTDFYNLQMQSPILWYDIGMLSTFALTGLFLGILSLRTMQRLVRHYAGGVAGWLFALAVLGLSGLGIYLGRFLRWNSWDLLLQPRSVLRDMAVRLAHPLSNLQIYGVTLLFAALMLVGYLTVASRENADSLTR